MFNSKVKTLQHYSYEHPDGGYDINYCMMLLDINMLIKALEKVIEVDGNEMIYPLGPQVAREALERL